MDISRTLSGVGIGSALLMGSLFTPQEAKGVERPDGVRAEQAGVSFYVGPSYGYGYYGYPSYYHRPYYNNGYYYYPYRRGYYYRPYYRDGYYRRGWGGGFGLYFR